MEKEKIDSSYRIFMDFLFIQSGIDFDLRHYIFPHTMENVRQILSWSQKIHTTEFDKQASQNFIKKL